MRGNAYKCGGAHFGWSATATMQKFILPSLKIVNDTIKSDICRHKNVSWNMLRFVFMGVPIVHPAVTRKYPSQNAERVRLFDMEIRTFVGDIPNFYVVNFTTMTSEAIMRTSDGFHALTDVNLMKVISLLNIMHSV